MFERNEQLTTAVDDLFAHCVNKDRGDMLLHEEIQNVSGIFRNQNFWQNMIEKLRTRMLNERGINLTSIRGDGYRLDTPREQLECPRRRQKRAWRQVHKGTKELSSLPSEILTLDEQIAKAQMYHDLIRDRRSLKRNGRRYLDTMKTSPTIPVMSMQA